MRGRGRTRGQKVQTSCGYGVPLIAVGEGQGDGQTKAVFEDRKTLVEWATKVIDAGNMPAYIGNNNSRSLDGLPGMKTARRIKGEKDGPVADVKAWVARVVGSGLDGLLVGFTIGVLSGMAISQLLRMG